MSASAVWRTVSGESTWRFTGRIWPSILILIGALEVKNRSEAFFSTISLNSGLVLRVGCGPPFAAAVAVAASSGSAGCGPVSPLTGALTAAASLAAFTGYEIGRAHV